MRNASACDESVSTQRHLKGRAPPKSAVCPQCGEGKPSPIFGGLCSMPCRERWSLDRSPQLQRDRIFKRDRGVCAACGIDTEALLQTASSDEMRALGFVVHEPWIEPLWNMDHIVEVAMGGGGPFNPSNLQSLCSPCHRSKTARFNSSRAREAA